MKNVRWSDIADPDYIELLDHKAKDEAHKYFDLDIQAGIFSIVRIEKRDSFLTYLKTNDYRMKLNRNAKLQKLKLWIHSKRFRIDEISTLEKFIVKPNTVHLDNVGNVNVEFQCITGDLVNSENVHIEIDSSLGNQIELEYLIPRWTYNFVSYWDQKKKKKIEYYEKSNLHGIRLRMSEVSYLKPSVIQTSYRLREYLMELVDKIVNEGWYLQSWKARYGLATWVVVAPQAGYLDQIREISTGGDIEAHGLESYFYNEGSWLPVIQTKNLTEGLKFLEDKISLYINNLNWRDAVFYAFERIIEVSDGHYGLSIAVEEEKDPILYKPDSV